MKNPFGYSFQAMAIFLLFGHYRKSLLWIRLITWRLIKDFKLMDLCVACQIELGNLLNWSILADMLKILKTRI